MIVTPFALLLLPCKGIIIDHCSCWYPIRGPAVAATRIGDFSFCRSLVCCCFFYGAICAFAAASSRYLLLPCFTPASALLGHYHKASFLLLPYLSIITEFRSCCYLVPLILQGPRPCCYPISEGVCYLHFLYYCCFIRIFFIALFALFALFLLPCPGNFFMAPFMLLLLAC